MKKVAGFTFVALFVLALTLALPFSAQAGGPECPEGSTVVKGQCEKTGTVVGHYTIEQYGCTYVVNYRGDFGDDPYLDNGRINNAINCKGGSVGSDNPQASANYNYVIVSEGEPQFGEADIWGTWDQIVVTEPGEGNVAP